MGLNESTKSITDITARALGAFIPVRSLVATDATATGVQAATDNSGNVLPGGLHYPGARTLHTLQASGTFVATCQLEGSQDNATFVALTPTAVVDGTASGASITTPGVFVYSGNYRSLRLNVTAYTSGSLSATLESAKP